MSYSVPSIISQACVVNNEGVALLSAGKAQDAMIFFRRSLTILDHSLHASSSSYDLVDSIISSSKTPTSGNHSTAVVFSCVPFLSFPEEEGSQSYRLLDGAMALCFGAGDGSHGSAGVASAYIPFITAVTMLNLALAFHQLGKMAVVSPCKSDKARAASFLDKADRMYQAVQRIVDATMEQEDVVNHDGFGFLSLAAQNNRLGIALEVSAGDHLLRADQLKQQLDWIIKSTTGTQAFHQWILQDCNHVERKYTNEFILNSTMLEMTGMLRYLPAPSA